MHKTGLVGRQLIRGIALLVVAMVATGALGSTAVAAETGTDHDRHPKQTAEEVCEPMVRDAVIAAAGRKLVKPRTEVWDGNTFACTYDFGAQGRITVTVEVMADHAAARKEFAARRASAPKRVTLFGMGQGAFRSGQTQIVARKDRFLLTVDGGDLTRAVNPSATTWSATRAVFDCW